MTDFDFSNATYQHTVMGSELGALMRSPKSTKAKKPRSKIIKPGADVLFCGHEAKVVCKHPEYKGWWVVSINGRETSGDRSSIKVL